MTATLGIPFIFKASFDKANRSSQSSFRGPGIEAGLKALAEVRKQVGVPVLTDVHEDTPLAEVAEAVSYTHLRLVDVGGARPTAPLGERGWSQGKPATVAGLVLEIRRRPTVSYTHLDVYKRQGHRR